MSANVHVLPGKALPEQFRLGDATVDLNLNLIRSGGGEHRITPKAAAVLRLLAVQPLRAVSRDALLGSAWADAWPTDDVLSHAITELRRALGDDARNSRFIETIPKVGYRLLVAPAALDPSATAGLARDPGSPAPAPGRRSFRTGVLTGTLVGALLGMVIGALVARGWFAAAPPAPARDPLADAFPVSARPGPEFMPAVSADGRQVAFVSAPAPGEPTDIVVKPILGEGVMNVTQTRGVFEYAPTWSPEGDRLAFLRFAEGACRVIVRPLAGGLERDLAPCIRDAVTYVDWSPDGRRLAMTDLDEVTGVSRIVLVDLASGVRTPLAYERTREHDVQPKFSPDGRWLLFRRGVNPRSELQLVSSAGGPVRPLTAFGSRIFGFAWRSDSERFWFCARSDGTPRLHEGALASPVSRPISGACPHGLSLSAKADVGVYEAHRGDANLVELGSEGDARTLFASTRQDREPAYAPDRQRLVFVSDRSGEDQLWLGYRETGAVHQLTRLAGLALSAPRFGADGETVIFLGRGAGEESLYRISVRSGIVERVSPRGERVRAGAVGPDGTLYLASDRSGSWQLWRLAPGQGDALQLTREGGHRPSVPGDGFVYYTRLDRYGVWRVPTTGGEETLVAEEVGFANHEAWVVRNGSLFYQSVVEQPSGESADAAPGEMLQIVELPLSPERQERIVLRLPSGDGRQLADVVDGGRRLLFTEYTEGEEDIVAVTNFTVIP